MFKIRINYVIESNGAAAARRANGEAVGLCLLISLSTVTVCGVGTWKSCMPTPIKHLFTILPSTKLKIPIPPLALCHCVRHQHYRCWFLWI